MEPRITRKIDDRSVPDPAGRAGDDDPWRDFRHVERLHQHLGFHFETSLGKVSRFFVELEQQRLMATRCPACGKVWMPPRALCGDDMTITTWVELPGHGTLEAASLSDYTLTTDGGELSIILGYVRLDGADTLLLQRIRNVADLDALQPGLRVKAAWATYPVAHPMQSFWFEPA